MSKEMTKAQTKELAEAGIDLRGEGGAGLEQAGGDDFAIPFFALLQDNSPQCKRADSRYIDGAQDGMGFDTVAQKPMEIPKEGLPVIPCFYRRAFVEWGDRDGDEGYIAEHSVEDGKRLLTTCTVNDKGIHVLPNGHELKDTRYHYVLIVDLDAGDYWPFVMGMDRTKIKRSRSWNSLIRNAKLEDDKGRYNPPSWALLYRLQVVSETRKNKTFWNWQIQRFAETEAESRIADVQLLLAAKAFYESIKSGAVREATQTQNAVGDEDVDGEDF